MAIQIYGITIEKTTLDDADLLVLDDPADGNKSKKFKISSLFTYIINKIGATAVEIARVCSGNTATAAEITQICDGVTRAGNSAGDIVTIDGAQNLTNKYIITPNINDATDVTVTGTQLNTLANTTGSGRVNEIQQGLALGNSTITSAGSYALHGLVNVNLGTTDSIIFGPVSSYNKSEKIAIENISGSTTVTVNRASSDRFFMGGTGYTSFVLTAGESITLMAMGSGKWLVLGYSAVTFS